MLQTLKEGALTIVVGDETGAVYILCLVDTERVATNDLQQQQIGGTGNTLAQLFTAETARRQDNGPTRYRR